MNRLTKNIALALIGSSLAGCGADEDAGGGSFGSGAYDSGHRGGGSTLPPSYWHNGSHSYFDVGRLFGGASRSASARGGFGGWGRGGGGWGRGGGG